MSALEIVLLVGGILVVVAVLNLAVWVPVARRSSRMSGDLTAELATTGEQVVLGPANGLYRGASAPGYSRVKGNSVVVLTDRRLIIRKVTGGRIEIPRAAVTGVREDAVFRGSIIGGRTHVIVEVEGGEVGFMVPDPHLWAETLAS